MIIRLIYLLMLVAFPAGAATYYISPSGSDANPGSEGSPWLTYSNAARTLAAGDTLLVQPGIYGLATNQNFYGYLRLVTVGTAENPITFKANGAVTNLVTFEVVAPYYKFEGFTWDRVLGVYARKQITGGSMPGPGSHHVIMTNCAVYNVSGDASAVAGFGQESAADHVPNNAPSYCQVRNCTFRNLTNSTVIALQGVDNLVEGNVLGTMGMCDAFRLFGSNNVVRLNTISNMFQIEGLGNHPDIIQFFGDNGDWSAANIFERNFIRDSVGVQLFDMSFQIGGRDVATLQTNSLYWGLTFRNNVMVNADMQASIDVPNVVFYNNTFRDCVNSLVFTWWDPDFWLPTNIVGNYFWQTRGWPTGGAVRNNAFINSSSYALDYTGPSSALLTNGAGTTVGYGKMHQDAGFYVWGVYSNIVGTITNVEISVGGSAYYNITNFGGGRFYRRILDSDGVLNGHTYADANSAFVGNTFRIALVLNDGTKEAMTPLITEYVPPLADRIAISNACNYNYYGYATENGYQSGATTNLVGTNFTSALFSRSMRGCILIDNGTNLTSSGVTNDYWGTARAQGSAFDIGAFEYDPSLKVHLDFDGDFSAGKILDVSGNTNDAWQMNATNWITVSNGVWGTSAGGWDYNGFLIPPDNYKMAPYAAITNVNGIAYLTNGTISFWAQIATNSDAAMQMIDTGYSPLSGGTSNSWSFGRNSSWVLSLMLYKNTNTIDLVNWPVDVVQGGGGSPNWSTTNMHLYTVAWSCTNNTAIAYYDGAPYMTNTVDVDYLRCGPLASPWICVGGMQHNGTPQWGDDMYPNGAFFVGSMDEVRIYDRQLEPTEVSGLYTGTGAAITASEGGGEPPADTPPTASFTGSPTRGLAPLNVTFNNSSIGTAPLGYAWTFGDGGTSTTASPTHNYASAGTNTVTLTVTNLVGTNVLTRTAYIAATNAPSATPPQRVNIQRFRVGRIIGVP